MARSFPFKPALLFGMSLLLGANAALAQTDADFLAAKDAYDRGEKRKLDLLAPALKGHLLEAYVAFWQLRLRIDDADADSVRAFLARFPDTPLADRLRNDWLKSLAKRGDWANFGAEYPRAVNEDIELACYGLQYRRRSEAEAGLLAAKPLWFTGASTPDACEPLFAALIAKGWLTNADRRARFRLASETGNVRLAQAIAGDLPGFERVTSREFMLAERDPARTLLKGEFAFKTPSGRDLALYVLERVARKDAEAAHASFRKWRERLPAADRVYGNLRIAYHAARQLNPAANAWFREAGDVALSGEQQTWRIRAALRVQAWDDVRAAIEALPLADQQDPAWRYWKARALAVNGETEAANELYAGLATEVHFYGLLAAEALGRGSVALTALKSDPPPSSRTGLDAFAARPEVRRAIKLNELDLRPEMLREWLYLTRGMDDSALLMAADFARRAGLYDRAINAAERTLVRHDFGLRYLTPFRSEFGSAARDQGIGEEVLYGIARQESRFVPGIVSAAGATGLMQLMPATARWVAKQLARNDFTPARVAAVDINTQFGAFYFKYWQDRLDGRLALAAAAYNAGPARAQSWRPAAAPLEGAIWVETIPFNETRDYVKKVLANTVLYARALNRPYVSLTDRLGVVSPRGSDTAALAAQAP